ncbi:DUF1398 family protein [Escherichia coli]
MLRIQEKNLATAGVFRWITNIHENKKVLLYL